MTARVVYRPLYWLLFGHERTVEVNEAENKSEYVCVRASRPGGPCQA